MAGLQKKALEHFAQQSCPPREREDRGLEALAGPLSEDVQALASSGDLAFPRVEQALRRFFESGGTVRRADTTNPVALLSNLRLMVQQGVGNEVGYDERGVHVSHFGRICPVETPEGDRIGVNLNTAILADVDADGRLLTPYRRCDDGTVAWLSAESEQGHVLGDLVPGDAYTRRYGGGVLAMGKGTVTRVGRDEVEYVAVHPSQALGVAASLIPFIAHDDVNRALMGANMQKQAVPLVTPEAPLVQTGMERQVVSDARLAGGEDCACPVADNGVLALGRNVLVGYLCWEGYNFEDGIVVSDRLVRDGVFTSVEARRQGDETVLVARKLKVGDKLCNRHGMKGVVAKIVPEAEMPTLPDGRTLDAILNPLGVPSRMNLGSILETHLGLAADALNCTVITPGFNGATVEEITAMLAEAGFPESGMLRLRDGRTGRAFDQDTTVGYMYVLKLAHMVDDKCQARAVGAYDGVSQQAVEGRSRQGGKRVGIMQTWALAAYRADHALQELLTTKSDSVVARDATYAALAEGGELPGATIPRSVELLAARLRGLCIAMRLFDAAGREVDVAENTTTVDSLAAASLSFASRDDIVGWSAGELDARGTEEDFAEVFGLDDGAVLRHIELPVPVTHAWGALAGEDAGVPDMSVLPVLAPSLHGTKGLGRLYLSVCAASRACRDGADPAAVAGLQAAVDAVIDRLTRMLRGKRGWITSMISGKTVDYCGRSVICPGPELDRDTCSIPIGMAAVLLEPVVAGAMVREGRAPSLGAARELLRERDANALAVLRREAESRYVLLHRAPTLHRLSVQAFRMRIADEDVVRIHPLTQTAFNADFDGDEMDVFLPLSGAAQAEAENAMRASLGQLSPANGGYFSMLSQDMVFGCYYASCVERPATAGVKAFASADAVAGAFDGGELHVHDPVTVAGRRTTVGRAMVDGLLPEPLRGIEGPLTKPVLRDLLARCWVEFGPDRTADVADGLLRFGFHQATLSGASIGKDVLRPYSNCEAALDSAWHEAAELAQGPDVIPGTDAHWALVDHWSRALETISDAALDELAADRDGLNAVHMMVASGARGSRRQIRQLVAVRGLMALPDHTIMSVPFTQNFICGHSPYEYFASAFGARKGLADTALRTADVGFLYKRVMAAVQDVTVVERDCGSAEGVAKTADPDGAHDWLPLRERITGRTALEDVVVPGQAEPIVSKGQIIEEGAAARLEEAGIHEVCVRSPVTCASQGGVCVACCGNDLSTRRPVRPGDAVGILAGQSIGEPATQLTMRTFHTATPVRGGRKDGRRGDILGGLPRLEQIFEAWSGKHADPESLADVRAMMDRAGVAATAEFLLLEAQKVYRAQGVRIDDRHFEVVLRQMLRGGELRGVSSAAADTDDFIVAGSVYRGMGTLARLVAGGERTRMDGIRSCIAFGKLLPTPDSA